MSDFPTSGRVGANPISLATPGMTATTIGTATHAFHFPIASSQGLIASGAIFVRRYDASGAGQTADYTYSATYQRIGSAAPTAVTALAGVFPTAFSYSAGDATLNNLGGAWSVSGNDLVLIVTGGQTAAVAATGSIDGDGVLSAADGTGFLVVDPSGKKLALYFNSGAGFTPPANTSTVHWAQVATNTDQGTAIKAATDGAGWLAVTAAVVNGHLGGLNKRCNFTDTGAGAAGNVSITSGTFTGAADGSLTGGPLATWVVSGMSGGADAIPWSLSWTVQNGSMQFF